MSQPRVTVTIGQGGQRSAKISSSIQQASDHSRGIMESRKRSTKDRLGGSSRNDLPHAYQMSNKRQRAETSWKQRIHEVKQDEDELLTDSHCAQNPRIDLRCKLDQKNSSRNRQFSAFLGRDLRAKFSPPPRPPQDQRIFVQRHPFWPVKGIPIIRPMPPPAAIASRIKAVQKVSVAIEQKPTVATLLQSLGLGKYSIIFQAEEIDMTALRNMNDEDLKELGLPMGPRKKILLALSPRKY